MSWRNIVTQSFRFLYLINLDTPAENVKKIPRQSKWDVGAVQWNRHSCYSHLFAATCNQQVDLYKWSADVGEIQTSLRGHTRVISDLDWSWYEAEYLVTCSVDTYIYIWDIKDTRKPAVSLSTVAGASQVKWNKQNQDIFATSHDGDVRIWDKRRANFPVEYMAAHLSRIHGLDWHPDLEFALVTCSQDNSAKFWDIRNPRKHLDILSCHVPVWKARYTPFSSGLITVMVPQLRRGENSLLLWNLNDLEAPVHTFMGHNDVVLEFQWRRQRDGQKYYLLVTWSRDQSLRIWRIDSQLQRLCSRSSLDGTEDLDEVTASDVDRAFPLLEPDASSVQPPGFVDAHSPLQPAVSTKSTMEEDVLSTKNASSPEVRRRGESQGQPQTLQQEFSLLNLHIPNITVDEMDAESRSCAVSMLCGNHIVKMVVTFPVNYPSNALPSFKFITPTSVCAPLKSKLMKILRDTSLQKVKRNQNCLEPCLRRLVAALDSLVTQEGGVGPNQTVTFGLTSTTVSSPLPFHRVINSYGSYQDSNVPFPRTSGARFCGAGYLVYFMRPITMNRSLSPAELTPRSLSALSGYHSSVMAPMKMRSESQSGMRLYSSSPTRNDKEVSISSFYYKERKMRRSKVRREAGDVGTRCMKAAGKVVVQDISCLLPIHRQLAELYILDVNHVQEMCLANTAAAASVGRRDLVQVWSLAAASTSSFLAPSSNPDVETPWAAHPFGRGLLKSLLAHYSCMHDVQTLALLCCTFDAQQKLHDQPKDQSLSSHLAVPSIVTSGSFSNTSDSGWNPGREQDQGTWCESTEDSRCAEQRPIITHDRERELHDKNKWLLDPDDILQRSEFKKCYGEILYRWGLKEKRAEVLKFVRCPLDHHKGVDLVTCCQQCGSKTRGVQCSMCRSYSFRCAICHVAVRGASNFCLTCGHGGHSTHVLEWFLRHNVCPTGCGCHCQQQNVA
uniref:GATOR2 complex protein WDR59 isoform X3 n=1 Tax=Myxine glutinosa TaxID=7769 RepID=UPI0035900280